MAELNDKLISYGNLSTFYDKLQEQGLGGNAIEEVSELPDASENKDKLFRLDNGEKDVYAAKLLSSTVLPPTNRLPDAQQIDKAYLYNQEDIYYYEGDWTIVCSDGNVTLKCWNYDIIEEWGYFTVDNAENITESSKMVGVAVFTYTDIDTEHKTVYVEDSKSDIIESVNNSYTLSQAGFIPIPAIYNAPESAQIGNATIDCWNNISEDFVKTIYTGDVIVYEGENWYKWNYLIQGEHDYSYIITNKKASEMFVYYNEGIDLWCSDAIFMGYNGETYETIDKDNRINIYIPQLNAPDSEQLNNAYIYVEGVEETFYYKGEITAHFTDGEMTLYRWENNEDSTYNIFTNEYAGAVNTYSQWAEYETYDNIELYWDSENEIWKSTQLTVSEVEEMFESSVLEGDYHTVKYQRTVVTEEWGWENITTPTYASDSDIDDLFISEIKLIRAQNVNENYIDWLVNTSGETMEFNGQTYYKWVVWANDYNGGSGPAVEETVNIVLTNTLNVQLPFNSDSPEFEYRISVDGEEMTSTEYIRGDYTQKTVQ